ncbi:hypothetical protein JANAI62_31070 [Jannaschia pagri]|uniref:DUF3576 domain-containing protein n=1 Tax=Jannaschia pagri TaxID=2829797 RepID=A0ABQ4NPZ1_9RHOB|nr:MULTISPECIES: DUF3576 domain-containing protein [unclassified Jannaschia]GIT92656.1 hypothetical protein JANAI61_31140 [Jannaschia sp. AI_61]GIT96484.1 hypothetical protein JANAI62_31070 [Jannaschia sp. AI_62]
MRKTTGLRAIAGLAVLATVASCGTAFFGRTPEERRARAVEQVNPATIARDARANSNTSSFFDLFENRDDPNTTLEVNKYLWNASLDVLSFMPVQNADPFSGVIQFGYGVPPGGGRAYQATVLIQDPALDARSLNVALRTRGGTASRETQRAIEDAILTRARQLRIADSRL